jgi:inhibitor of cysteine peptidase
MAAMLTPADSGSVLNVTSGDAFDVRLPENPTTGYRWTVDSTDETVLRLDASPFESGGEAGVGGGGTRVLRFSVIGAGSATLRLKLWREWEGDGSILDRFAVTINSR